MTNPKIKFIKKSKGGFPVNQWVVSHDEMLKQKVYRKQEWFRDEESAQKRFKEIYDNQKF